MSELHHRRGKGQTIIENDEEIEERVLNNNNPNNKNEKKKFFENNTEKYLFYVVIFLSFLTRFYKLHFPGAVLFDEVHFVSMAQWYNKRTYFFDIHPPLAKLCLAAICWLTGFHLEESYRDIGKVFLHNGYIAMRMWQAFHGAILPIIAYLTVKELRGSGAVSFLVSCLLIFELSFQTISRAVLLDSFLYSSIAFGFYCALRMWRENENKNFSSFSFCFWAIFCGISIGCAFSIKHTGLSVVGYVGLIHLYKTLKPLYISHDHDHPLTYIQLRNQLIRMIVAGFYLIAAVIGIYILSFVIHFTVLNHTGIDEDSMSDAFRSQLIGSKISMPAGETAPSMWENIVHLNRKMVEINSASIFEHYHSSSWYEWPVLYKGIVYFWETIPGGPYHICVYLFGNPIVYWVALLFFLFALIYVDRFLHFLCSDYPLSSADFDRFVPIFYCVFAYLSNMLPYVFIKRTCYLYHYHPSLYYAIILIGLFFDKISLRRLKNYLIALFLLIVVIVYLYYLPFSYALPLTEEEHDARRWFKSTLFPYW